MVRISSKVSQTLDRGSKACLHRAKNKQNYYQQVYYLLNSVKLLPVWIYFSSSFCMNYEADDSISVAIIPHLIKGFQETYLIN